MRSKAGVFVGGYLFIESFRGGFSRKSTKNVVKILDKFYIMILSRSKAVLSASKIGWVFVRWKIEKGFLRDFGVFSWSVLWT